MDAKSIFPYLGLFTSVTLNPTGVIDDIIPTPYLLPLSIIRGKKFVKAPSKSKNVARIFNPLVIDSDKSLLNPGVIPISPVAADQTLSLLFKEKRYWRIPLDSAAVFAALIDRLLRYDSSGCKDIRLAKLVYYGLGLQSVEDEYSSDENDGYAASGPSGGGGGGGGRSGDGKGASLNRSPRKGTAK